MKNLKKEALENIQEFINSTPKEEIIKRLMSFSKTNKGGPLISEIIDGCFDEPVYFYLQEFCLTDSISEMIDLVTCKVEVTSDGPPQYYRYEKINIKNPQSHVGFLFKFAEWKN